MAMKGWTEAWLCEVVAAAAAVRDAGGRPVAAFDFDQTCIEGDLGAQFHLELSREGAYRLEEGSPLRRLLATMPEAGRLNALLSAPTACGHSAETAAELACLYTRVLRARGSAEAAAWAPLLHAGMEEEELCLLAERVWGDLSEAPREARSCCASDGVEVRWTRGVRVRPRMVALIARLEAAGVEVRIVSQTNAWALRPAMRALGLQPERAVGSRCEVEGGRLEPRLELPTTFREGKVLCHAAAAGDGAVLLVAAGDSENDLALLRSARFGVWVERGDGRHLREASDRGWMIAEPSWLMEPATDGSGSPS